VCCRETYGRCVFIAKMMLSLTYVLGLTYFVIWSNPLCHDDLMDAALHNCIPMFHERNQTTINATSELRDCHLRVQDLREDCNYLCPGRIISGYSLLIMAMVDILYNLGRYVFKQAS
jgi:hypothetical protein